MVLSDAIMRISRKEDDLLMPLHFETISSSLTCNTIVPINMAYCNIFDYIIR